MLLNIGRQRQIDRLINDYKYVAFFSNNESSSKSDSSLSTKRELFRVAVTPTFANDVMTINYIIPSNYFCPSTTIASASSPTEFTLVSPSGFGTGDRVQIKLLGADLDRRLALSGSVATVPSLGTVPPIGTKVTVMITQVAVIVGGGSSAGTGTMEWIFDVDIPPKIDGAEYPGSLIINIKGSD